MTQHPVQTDPNFLKTAAAIWNDRPMRPVLLFTALIIVLLALLSAIWAHEMKQSQQKEFRQGLENHILRLVNYGWPEPKLDSPQEIKDIYAALQQNIFLEIQDKTAQETILQLGTAALREDSLYSGQSVAFNTKINGTQYHVTAIRPARQYEDFYALAPITIAISGFLILGWLAWAQSRTNRTARSLLHNARTVSESHDSLIYKLQELESENTALHKNADDMAHLVDSVSDIIFELSPDGDILYVNQIWQKLTGISPAQALGQSLYDLLHEEDIAGQKERLKKLAAGRRQVQRSEVRLKDAQGQYRMVDLSLNRLRFTPDKQVRVIGTIRDIQDRFETESALREAKKQSDFANRAKSEFLANMSHELRTPLNAIIGFSEILKDQIFGKIEQKEYVEYAQDIHASGRHLLDVINEILDFSKIEAGKRELHDTIIHIAPIAESALRMVQPKAEQQKIEIINKISDSLPKIQAEELAMKQILINLLTNAVKFTNEGGTVTLTAQINQAGSFDIMVTDTGIGMAENDIEKALSPFGQINSSLSRKESGTGLGLSLVKSLVELHGGELVIDSTPNKGTVMTIRLPQNRIIKDRA